MSLDDEIKMLRNVPMFSNVETSKLKLLAFTSERLTFHEGDILCQQGDSGNSAFLILEGTADIITETDSGPIKVASLGANDIVGEIAMLCDIPRTATVKAASKLVALEISRDVFFRLIRDFPDMAVEIMRELAHRLNATTQQLREAKAASKNA